MGSRTTAIVSLGLQRLVIGFEIKQEYCDIAATRIDYFLSQKQLISPNIFVMKVGVLLTYNALH